MITTTTKAHQNPLQSPGLPTLPPPTPSPRPHIASHVPQALRPAIAVSHSYMDRHIHQTQSKNLGTSQPIQPMIRHYLFDSDKSLVYQIKAFGCT